MKRKGKMSALEAFGVGEEEVVEVSPEEEALIEEGLTAARAGDVHDAVMVFKSIRKEFNLPEVNEADA